MAADPKYGTFYARGRYSGTPYAVDMYYSDVAAALIKFDAGAGAGASSADFYTFPEDVIITDFSINAGAAGTYAATNIRITVNGAPTPNVLRVKNHLDTLNNRPPLALKLLKGSRLGGIQNA